MGPCRVWTKACSKKGYGQRWHHGKVHYVHRDEWEKHHGPIPAGLDVCHHCDNPPCYEITHLFLGTRDREALVRRYLAGESSAALAEEFGVHPTTVAKYARRHAPDETRARWGGARR